MSFTFVPSDDVAAIRNRLDHPVIDSDGHLLEFMPLVRDIIRMRDEDPNAPDGPTADLIVQLHGTDALEHPDLGAVGPIVPVRTGAHTTNGFAYLTGPGITPGARGTHAVCDLSATVATLVGAGSGPRLDGRSILDPDGPR